MTTTVEAVYQDGVFKPTASVALPDNQRVRLRVESLGRPDVEDLLEQIRTFHERWIAERGPLPDSTPDIAEDRRRDV
jgi:predicted DNA-binding antitoxin AbrB/MazE fold protein